MWAGHVLALADHSGAALPTLAAWRFTPAEALPLLDELPPQPVSATPSTRRAAPTAIRILIGLVTTAASRTRRRRGNLLACRGDREPAAVEGVQALAVRVAGLAVVLEQVERMAVVGDLP